MIKLDLKDRKILYELDSNSRQPISRIAKAVRLNKGTVNYKIRQMEDAGIISGYYAMIDNTKLGYLMFRIYLKFINTTTEKEEEIIRWAKNNKAIGVIGRIETVYDLMLMVWVRDAYEFDEFLHAFKKRFREYFWQEKVHLYTKVWHFRRKYLLEHSKPQDFEFVGSNRPQKCDDLDLEILGLLSQDARMPVVQMSAKLKAPERTVAFRIRQLEKNKVIQGYRTNINLEKIGYEYYKLNICLQDYDKFDELFEFCRNHPNVIYIDRTASELDFEIDVEIESKRQLLKLVAEMKSRFHVRDVEFLSYSEYYKIESLPRS